MPFLLCGKSISLRIKCIICGFKKRGSVRDEANYTVRTFMI
jgi:hypothetical protein